LKANVLNQLYHKHIRNQIHVGYAEDTAENLGKQQIVYYDDIRNYCSEEGLNYRKVLNSMKELGIHIRNHELRRRKPLKDYLD